METFKNSRTSQSQKSMESPFSFLGSKTLRAKEPQRRTDPSFSLFFFWVLGAVGTKETLWVRLVFVSSSHILMPLQTRRCVSL